MDEGLPIQNLLALLGPSAFTGFLGSADLYLWGSSSVEFAAFLRRSIRNRIPALSFITDNIEASYPFESLDDRALDTTLQFYSNLIYVFGQQN